MKPSKLRLTLGSDPEMMLVDSAQGKIVNALRVLKQNKHNPIMLGQGVKMYADNVLVETSFAPAKSVRGVVTRLRDVFALMQNKLGDQFRLLPQAAHVYGEDELGPKPQVMKGLLPEEWEIGCNPSFNVYTRDQTIPTPFTDGLRTGSFHLHIGNADFEKPDETKLMTLESKEEAIKLMDVFVGCVGILFDHDESSPKRRALYGKAGEFRPTPYGVEYRVLSNYALRHPELAQLVFDLAEYAMSHVDTGTSHHILNAISPYLVQQAINMSDKKLAAEVVQRACLPHKLADRVAVFVDNPLAPDIYKAWAI